MALRRVPARSSQKTNQIITWTNRLSGSVFDLEPGTAYEIDLKLHDLDGGDVTQIVKTATRPEAIANADAALKNGTKADLMALKPREVLLLADGYYGAVVLQRDGEPVYLRLCADDSGCASYFCAMNRSTCASTRPSSAIRVSRRSSTCCAAGCLAVSIDQLPGYDACHIG